MSGEQLEFDFDNTPVRLKQGSIEVKRFYLPVALETKCPQCGTVHVDNFEDNYLSYPNLGLNERYMWCDNCESEYHYDIELVVEVSKKGKERVW